MVLVRGKTRGAANHTCTHVWKAGYKRSLECQGTEGSSCPSDRTYVVEYHNCKARELDSISRK